MAPRQRTLWLVAIALAAAASLFWALFPGMSSVSSSTSVPGGVETTTAERRSLIESEGASVIPILIAPPMVLALPLLVRGRARRSAMVASAVLVTAFAVLGALSIGFFYLPAVIAAWVATALGVGART